MEPVTICGNQPSWLVISSPRWSPLERGGSSAEEIAVDKREGIHLPKPPKPTPDERRQKINAAVRKCRERKKLGLIPPRVKLTEEERLERARMWKRRSYERRRERIREARRST